LGVGSRDPTPCLEFVPARNLVAEERGLATDLDARLTCLAESQEELKVLLAEQVIYARLLSATISLLLSEGKVQEHAEVQRELRFVKRKIKRLISMLDRIDRTLQRSRAAA
jgi:hypothetical protein